MHRVHLVIGPLHTSRQLPGNFFYWGIVGISSAYRHHLPPYMATTSHARYLLGTPAPRSAVHGDDFTRSVSSRHTGTIFPPIAMTSLARYLLGTPAPSSAVHGDDFKHFYYRQSLRPPLRITTKTCPTSAHDLIRGPRHKPAQHQQREPAPDPVTQPTPRPL
jgi:hypothetical protein